MLKRFFINSGTPSCSYKHFSNVRYVKTNYCQKKSSYPHEGCVQRTIAEKHAFIPYVYIVILREIDVKIDIKILLKTFMH